MAADDATPIVSGLEAAFDARIARAEDEAASDLAFSLLQDLTLAEALQRAGAIDVVRPGGMASPAVEIGPDYVICAFPRAIVPLRRAVFRGADRAELPKPSDEPLVTALRALARTGRTVEVGAGGSRHRGRLARAGRDHLVIEIPERQPPGSRPARTREVYVPLTAVGEIVLLQGGAR